jgi:acyl-CoA reductase-like NAD-dependent aldehyde dehydrogenase
MKQDLDVLGFLNGRGIEHVKIGVFDTDGRIYVERPLATAKDIDRALHTARAAQAAGSRRRRPRCPAADR